MTDSSMPEDDTIASTYLLGNPSSATVRKNVTKRGSWSPCVVGRFCFANKTMFQLPYINLASTEITIHGDVEKYFRGFMTGMLVVHKLGHGSFSTVQLAIDEKTPKYVAIKVGTTDTSRSEIDTISTIMQNAVMDNMRTDRKLLFPTVLYRFGIIGPNGTHPWTLPRVRDPSSTILTTALIT